MIDELTKVKNSLLESEQQLSQANSDLSKAQNEVGDNKIMITQLLELNQENEQLRKEINEARASLLSQSGAQQGDIKQALMNAKANFDVVKQAYEELRASTKE